MVELKDQCCYLTTSDRVLTVYVNLHGHFFTALRAAAAAVKQDDNRRLFHNSSLRKRRKEVGDQIEALNRLHKVTIQELSPFNI